MNCRPGPDPKPSPTTRKANGLPHFREAGMNIYWDIETYSQCNLKDYGAHRYATDPSTGMHFFCYACDDSEVQVWRLGDPAPEPFANPTQHWFVSDNWEFERTLHTHILVKRCGFPPI